MEDKALNVTDMEDIKAKVSDVEVHGDPGAWVLLCKASSQAQGWMKSTKMLAVPGGTIYQMETQQKNLDCTYSLSQSSVFVPGASFNARNGAE